jgi:hypothetical protein
MILPFGANMNRVVGGRFLSTVAMANFGFALSLYEYVKRYLPAQLLVGLIRPLVVARYSEKQDFSVAANLCEQVLLVNAILIGFCLVLLQVGGVEALTILSGGKYGFECVPILSCLLVVLLLETNRLQLEVLVQTIERYSLMIPSNIMLSASIFAAVVMLPSVGAIAFPVANVVALILANIWVQHQLKLQGYNYQHDWFAMLQITTVIVLSVIVGWFIGMGGSSWYWGVFASAIAYIILGWWLFGNNVLALVTNLMGKDSSIDSVKEICVSDVI